MWTLGLAALAIVFAACLGIVIGTAHSFLDRRRITASVQERGGRIISINPRLGLKELTFMKYVRTYEVIYSDGEGKQHSAVCTTSPFVVRWTNDAITHRR